MYKWLEENIGNKAMAHMTYAGTVKAGSVAELVPNATPVFLVSEETG